MVPQTPDEFINACELFHRFVISVWEQLTSLLGVPATCVILRNAQREAVTSYAFLADIRIGEDGVDVSGLCNSPHDVDVVTVRDAFVCFADQVATLVGDLTGNLLAGQMAALAEELQRALGSEGKDYTHHSSQSHRSIDHTC